MARPDNCSAVLIDDRVTTERWVHRNATDESNDPSSLVGDECATLRTTVESLLEVCKQIYLCHSGKSFAATLADLNERSGSDCTPIFAFVDVDVQCNGEFVSARRRGPRDSIPGTTTPSSGASLLRNFTFSSESEDSYGVQLLALLSSDLQLQEGPKLIIPVAVLRSADSTSDAIDNLLSMESNQVARCLDAGAVDVLSPPLQPSRVHGLVTHAYRVRRAAQKEITRFMAIKKSRKQSWVGVQSEQPYAYLREAMVSKLMKSICNPEEMIDEFQDRELSISDERRLLVESKVGDWDFSAHDFSEDELVYAGCAMLGHAMTVPEVEHWRLTEGELRTFMLASRAAYNSFVLYHNFRHAVDVLQSVFSMLLHIGALPTYALSTPLPPISKSPVASLISPVDALALLISAIGHDVGHPGVNNIFLVKLNAPLAQLYNDSSVLEAFHCAAFSQILRRHWPAAFKDLNLRKLLISSILATDMGVHFKFMGRMWELQKKYHQTDDIDDWTSQDRETYRTLLCGLIIKCADISNVARPWQIAERWTHILQQEFANQGEMEKEIGMETALFGGPPELGNMVKLATSQINFMAVFALPLFEGVADLCPQMVFACQQIQSNRTIWQDLSDRHKRPNFLRSETDADSARSPRSSSPEKADEEEKEEEMPVSQVQENVAGGSDAVKARVTLDPPPHALVDAPPPSAPKRLADKQVDLSLTTFSGFQTSMESRQGSSEHPSVTDDNGNTLGFQDSKVATHDESPDNCKSSSCGQASRPSSSYGVGRDIRTQSASTGTNTVATPVSPVTNATSFVSLDSDYGQSSASDVNDTTEGESRSRPSSSGHNAGSDIQQPKTNGHYLPEQSGLLSHRIDDLGKSHHVMTTILRNGTSSRGSSSVDDETPKAESPRAPQDVIYSSLPWQTLPRKKSRIRLAFWKRRSPPLQ